MAIETTHNGAVALYDSIKMQAFGPIFEDAERAENFVGWVAETHGVLDVRVLPIDLLGRLHLDWSRKRLDEDGYLRETAAV